MKQKGFKIFIFTELQKNLSFYEFDLTKLTTYKTVLRASSMSPTVLIALYDEVNYMYGSIERLFHVSSSIVSLM